MLGRLRAAGVPRTESWTAASAAAGAPPLAERALLYPPAPRCYPAWRAGRPAWQKSTNDRTLLLLKLDGPPSQIEPARARLLMLE